MNLNRHTLGVWAVAALACGALGMHPENESLIGNGDPGEGARFGDVPMSNMMMLSHLDLDELDPLFGSFEANDCWGYVTPTGREIAMIGMRNAISFVDMTDPYDPVVIATHQSPASLWHDVKVIDDHAYAVTENTGHIQVFDLSQADAGVIVDRGFTSFGGSSSTHNICADEVSGYLYRCGSNNSLRVYSVGARGLPGSPTNPVQTNMNLGFYVHDAQVVTYQSGPYAGRQIGFLSTGSSLRIWDLTNKQSPFQIANVSYPGARYPHQGWLDDSGQYFYLNDELDAAPTKMHIFNVGSLENASYVKAWTNGNSSIDHNLYIVGDLVYASNYTSGLRVFDIENRENPVEIAWIDTYPSSDSATFDGTWSNYPFFPSGNVVVSDMQSGMFVVRPQLDILKLTPEGALPEMFAPTGGTEVRITIEENNRTLDPGTLRLTVRENDGELSTVSGTFDAGVATFITPRLSCPQNVGWWAEASTTDGDTFGYPVPGGLVLADAVVSDGMVTEYEDNAESDPGWVITGTASAGAWQRGVPVNAGRGDPSADADGSGRAWLTENSSANGGNSDVDGGSTIMTSPVLGPLPGGSLSFSYWLSDISGSRLSAGDTLTVLVNYEDGAGWRTARVYNDASNQWRTDRLMPGFDLPDGGVFRVRFTAKDNFPENVVEAGIDNIMLEGLGCIGCNNPADVNADGLLAPSDFSAWIVAFNDADPIADQNSDSLVTPADFNAWIVNYNAGGCD